MAKRKPAEPEWEQKVLLLGDSGVGKTALLLRFAESLFSYSYTSTIGIDYRQKNLTVPEGKVHMQIWDTAGQERFRTLTRAYYRKVTGIALVYSIDDPKSFQDCRGWLYSLQEHLVSLVLVANKQDLNLKQTRHILSQQGEVLARQWKIPFFETSAKENMNVNAPFEALARLTIARMRRERMARYQATLARLNKPDQPGTNAHEQPTKLPTSTLGRALTWASSRAFTLDDSARTAPSVASIPAGPGSRGYGGKTVTIAASADQHRDHSCPASCRYMQQKCVRKNLSARRHSVLGPLKYSIQVS
eukprot:g71112.t1